MREVVLTAASLALTGAVVANAYYQKHQFYPSVVYLTKSSPSMAVSRRPSMLNRMENLLSVAGLSPSTIIDHCCQCRVLLEVWH